MKFTLKCTLALALFLAGACQESAETTTPAETTILASVPNFGFAAVWVAEQLDYFKEEGITAKVAVAGGGATCLAAIVGRSADFCATSSDGLILSKLEGAPLIALQTHNTSLSLSVTVRKALADQAGLTRESPIESRLRFLSSLETIGASSPGAASQQIFKFLVSKAGGDPEALKFVYLGGAQLPLSLMNGVIDAFALSPPSGERTEAADKGYVLIPLASGDVEELANYPYEVLVAHPDSLERDPSVAKAVSRAISRGAALIRENPQEAKSALRAHPLFGPDILEQSVFDLSFSIITDAMPLWGDMSEEGWQKVIDFTSSAGLISPEQAKELSAEEGVFWTNEYVGKK